MPEFLFTDPDGRTHSITGPDGATPQQAFEMLQKQLGAKPAAPPDPYKEAARTELAGLREKGAPVDMGYAGRIAHGMTLGASDEIMAGLTVPFEMIKRKTWDPAEAYRHTKAREDVLLEEARARQGVPGHIAEIGGGVATGLGAARAGFTLAKSGAGVARNTAAGAVEGAGYGGVSGFLDSGNTLDERFAGAKSGAAVGAGVGAVLPTVAKVIGTVAAPVVSNVRARLNPQGVATSQVARAAQESGRPVHDIVNDITTAAAEGQPMFTAADAMGNAGQNMLKTAASAPGPGRTNTSNFLDARQAGQGRRVQNTIAEGFDAPITAQQAEQGLTTVRDNAAGAAFGAARQGANPVNLRRAIATIDATLSPGATQIARPQSGLRSDTIESALEGVRSRLTDNRSMLTDYVAVERVRGDLADAVQMAVQRGQGNRARMLGQVLREIDTAMEAASPGFRRANAQYAAHSRDIEAVGQGRNAAQRGRSEDVIRDFQGRTPPNQQPYRVGYADRLIENAQGAPGVNKARFVAPEEELAALAAPGRGPMMQGRLGRENTMFETRHKAFGGSRTAENLADNSAMTVDPSIVAMVLSGQFGRAARQTLAHASNALHGNTPAVREHIAELLLQRGSNPNIGRTITDEIARTDKNAAIARALMQAATVGTSVGYAGQRSR